MELGKHLTTLNLFREPDGTVEITVHGGGCVMEEWHKLHPAEQERLGEPIHYVEELIVEAADRIKKRRQ